MFPKIRVDKLHPDGSARASWEAYRVEDRDGAVRFWTPARTPRIHVNGRWTPESPFITAWVPGQRFVVARYEDADGLALYIDIVREVAVTHTRFAYVDLYVDVVRWHGGIKSKDEELLHRLSAKEADTVLATRDSLMRAVRAEESPFFFDHPRWDVPDAARALPPGNWLELP